MDNRKNREGSVAHRLTCFCQIWETECCYADNTWQEFGSWITLRSLNVLSQECPILLWTMHAMHDNGKRWMTTGAILHFAP